MQRRVEVDGTEYVLVGTAHVSAESVSEVGDIIDAEEPDAVAVELDRDRYDSLRDADGWADLDVTEVLSEGKGHLLLLNVLLAIYQRRLGSNVDVRPGAEMLAAVDAAEERDVPIELIDRDVSETMRAALDGLTVREKLRLVAALTGSLFGSGEEVTAEDIEELKERDALEAVMTELGGTFPSIHKAFLTDRDAYMAGKLREMESDHVVAVVGAAHVDGIAERLESGDVAVEEVEPGIGRHLWTAVSYGVPALIVGMFAYIFLFVGVGAGASAFSVWFMLNAAGGGLGALAARAHPGTVLAAALAAPFTSVNPALPSGLVAAYVENRFDPPTVGDLEAVATVDSYGAFWDNRALNLVLVFLLVNVGSSIASYLGGGYLAQLIT